MYDYVTRGYNDYDSRKDIYSSKYDYIDTQKRRDSEKSTYNNETIMNQSNNDLDLKRQEQLKNRALSVSSIQNSFLKEANNQDTTNNANIPKNTKNPSNCSTTTTTVIMIVVAIVIGAFITFCILYFVVFARKPTYKEACSTSNLCADNKQLTCDSVCKCDTTRYWDGFICTPLLSFGSTCYGGTFQCQTGLSCLNQICQCSSTQYYDGQKCVQKLPYGSICSNCSYPSCKNCLDCNQCQDYSSLYCNQTSLRCECFLNTHYFDLASQLCVLKVGYYSPCLYNSMCKDVTHGLTCPTITPGSTCPSTLPLSVCNCATNAYYNGSICKLLELYKGICVQNCSCDTSKGLFCDAIYNNCICQANYYWDLNTLVCLPQQIYNYPCTYNAQCDTNKGLACVSSKCQCGAFTGTWYWSSFGLRCIECPLNWKIITFNGVQKCVRVFYDWVTWNNAFLFCSQFNARLIKINDTNLVISLRSYLGATYYWVGSGDQKNEGVYSHIYDGQNVNFAVIPWCTANSEPTSSSFENCMFLNTLTSNWCYYDYQCYYSAYPLCEKNL